MKRLAWLFACARRVTRAQRGVSLIEVSLSLVVLGLVSGGALSLMHFLSRAKVAERTHTHKERIFYALANFARVHGRLPCPAEPLATQSKGTERPRCQSPELACGAVPFRTLGLSEACAKSGAGQMMAYVVHPQMTLSARGVSMTERYCAIPLKPLIRLFPGSLTRDPVVAVLITERVDVAELASAAFDLRDIAQRKQLFFETRGNLAAYYGRFFCESKQPSAATE